MNKLSNNIYHYYLQHYDELPLDKQLHFAARLSAWSDDETCQTLLHDMRGQFADQSADKLLTAIHLGQVFAIKQGSSNALSQRKPFLDRYPDLRHTAALLYWVHAIETALDIPLRSQLGSVVDLDALDTLYLDLLTDDPAVAMLSTHAVNFLYLYPALTNHFPAPVSKRFLSLSSTMYNLNDPVQLQLCIYLLTHVIIGESLFYTRPVPPAALSTCQTIVQRLESLIDEHYSQIKLDNKFEFLVCCRLVEYISPLEERIMAEAETSLAPDGPFLIDTHNQNPSADYARFEKSEHRNVLFIMATTAQLL